MNYKTKFKTVSTSGDVAKYYIWVYLDVKESWIRINQYTLTKEPEGYGCMTVRKRFKDWYLIGATIAIKLTSLQIINSTIDEISLHELTRRNHV